VSSSLPSSPIAITAVSRDRPSASAFRGEKAAGGGGLVNAIFSRPFNFLPERPGARARARES